MIPAIDAVCWIVGDITKENFRQPKVACGSTSWAAAAVDDGVVTCLDCKWIINERKLNGYGA